MGITVIVTLFTSRIILRELGVEDFGIFNVIGGFVSLMTFINGSLMHGIQRYLNYYKAQKNTLEETKIFSASYYILGCLAIVIIGIGETFGLWFLNNYLNIPSEKLFAANCVYQFSILTCLISLIQIPLTAAIVANEDMHVYAFVAFVEVGLKLLIAYLLYIVLLHKLIIYSILVAATSGIITSIYLIYCKKKYSICKIIKVTDKNIYLELLSFSGWTVFGTSANVMSVQGINVIVNIFFGAIVNAARGIAVQVSTQLDNLINNIQVAMNPQLIQLFSAGNLDVMQKLMIDNFRWNFYLFWLCACPIFFNTKSVLYYWLGEIPDFTIIFTQLIIIRCLLKVFERPLMTAVIAYGKIKWPCIISGSILLFEVVLCWLLFKIGFTPQWAYILDLGAISLCIIYDINFLRSKGIFGFKLFISDTLPRPAIIAGISILLALLICHYFKEADFISFLIRFTTIFLISGITIFIFGFTASQRKILTNKFFSILHIKN